MLLVFAASLLTSCADSVAALPPTIEPVAVSAPTLTPTSNRPQLRVAFTDQSAANASLWMAHAADLFRKHQLDVALVQQTDSAALDGLLGNHLDVVVGSGATAVQAAVGGAELRLVAGLVNLLPYRLMVASSIDAAGDLPRGRVAVGRPGSTADVAVRLALEELDLRPGADVPAVQIGAPLELLAALENGAVQAAAVTPPDTVLLERLGFVTLLDLTNVVSEYPGTQAIVPERLVRANPERVQRFVNSLIEATALAKRERALTKQVLRHYLYTADEAALEDAYDLYVQRLAARAPYPADGSVRRLWRTLSQNEPRAALTAPPTLIERRFVQEAVDSGFAGQLYLAR
jgi:ABC-type nitrate/sulfonate/bicarbonate transport system substrate-binding protein